MALALAPDKAGAMRRLLAHIGAHKTGTTAFQSWLQEHREALLEAGYLVPAEGSTGNNGSLAKALYSVGRSQKKVDRLFAHVAQHPSCDILMSAEHLSSISGEELQTAAARLSQIADRKIAILVVRDPVAHFNSGFAQRRKAMRFDPLSFSQFLEHSLQAGRADWSRRIANYEAKGFEVRVLPYSAEFKAKGSPRAILELPDFGDLAERFDWTERPSGNASMGAIGLIMMDLLREMSAAQGTAKDKRSSAQLRDRVIKVATRRFGDTPFNGFTPEQRQRVIDHYRERNAWVAERFFQAPWDEVLPPESERPASPEHIADLPPARAAKVRSAAAKIFAEAQAAGWI